MVDQNSPTLFAGPIPKLYQDVLVPMIFRSYAEDLAGRWSPTTPSRVLEVAAGTGVLTRVLARSLPATVDIVATDLNQPMLDLAAEIGTDRSVEWREADAMALPFPDGSFDAVFCQFGVMFFPDRPKAFAEVLRVLKPGGFFLFNTWDKIQTNEFAHVVSLALASVFPEDPPRFIERIPHGYFEAAQIESDLRAGGFEATPKIETVGRASVAPSARMAAVAYCQGTPIRHDITTRDASRLAEATAVAEEALSERFGVGQIHGNIRAHVVVVSRIQS